MTSDPNDFNNPKLTIQELKDRVSSQMKEIERLKAENERLREINQSQQTALNYIANEARFEFLESLLEQPNIKGTEVASSLQTQMDQLAHLLKLSKEE